MHELRAGSLVQQQLAHITHFAVGGVEQDGANLLGNGNATWLAQTQHVITGRIKERSISAA